MDKLNPSHGSTLASMVLRFGPALRVLKYACVAVVLIVLVYLSSPEQGPKDLFHADNDGILINQHFKEECILYSYDEWKAAHGSAYIADSLRRRAGKPLVAPVTPCKNFTTDPGHVWIEGPRSTSDKGLADNNATVDMVYTWMNGTDPEFLKKKSEALNTTIPYPLEAHLHNTDYGELFYSLRGVQAHMKWVNHIFVVTPSPVQIPDWLDPEDPGITFIGQDDLYPDKYKHHIPVFSSTAVEAHLHRIPNLSDHYIYMNDDFFIGRDMGLDFFFNQEKGRRIQMRHRSQNAPPGSPYYDVYPECSPGCAFIKRGDTICDIACNTPECGYDSGDCENKADPDRTLEHVKRERSYPEEPLSADAVHDFMDSWFNSNYQKTMMLSNSLLDHEFGFESGRFSMTHCPFLLDKSIMADIWEWWPEVMESTSKTKTRSGVGEIHPAFLHNHIVRSLHAPASFEDIWKEINVDGDNFLDYCEVKKFMLNFKDAMKWTATDKVPAIGIRNLLPKTLMLELTKIEQYGFSLKKETMSTPSSSIASWLGSFSCSAWKVDKLVAKQTPLFVELVRLLIVGRKVHHSYPGSTIPASFVAIDADITRTTKGLHRQIAHRPLSWNNNNNLSSSTYIHEALMRAFFSVMFADTPQASWELRSTPHDLRGNDIDRLVKIYTQDFETTLKKSKSMWTF